MIKIEITEVVGWEAAIRGMRNPMNSWNNSDSIMLKNNMILGESDIDLMERLRNAGTDHRKFMRMIAVYCDITAPLYWWKEFDTYKVGTVANSCSTMHKIAAKEFTPEDFSHEHLISLTTVNQVLETGDAYSYENGEGLDEHWDAMDILSMTIDVLNFYRNKYINAKTKPLKDETKRAGLIKTYWWQMIQLLPSSYNQRRTVMLNYEVLANMYKSRKNHKLDEWRDFCLWIRTMPYSQLITGEFDISEVSDSEK